MDPAYLVLALSLLITVLGIFYMRLMAMHMTDRVVAEARALVPDAERVMTQLRTVHGKAMSTVKTAKKALNAPPDDDDVLRALDHPLAKGIARGAGIDVDKIKAGDEAELKKAMSFLGNQKTDANTNYL